MIRRHLSRSNVIVTMLAVSAATLVAAPSAGGALIADYQLNGTMASSVGTAPPLTDVGTGTSAFQTDTVNGCTRQVLAFPAGHGFSVPVPPSGLEGDYAAVVQFRLDSVGTAAPGDRYKRLIGVDGNTGTAPAGETGLFFDKGLLNFYNPSGNVPDVGVVNITAPGTYVDVAFRRDREVGANVETMTVFRNGQLRIQFSNGAGGYYALTNDTLTLFKDDAEPNEESGGAVSRILVFNTAPTNDELTTSLPAAPCVPPPSSAADAAAAAPTAAAPTGRRAAAVRKCKKKKSKRARRNCRRKARRLPL